MSKIQSVTVINPLLESLLHAVFPAVEGRQVHVVYRAGRRLESLAVVDERADLLHRFGVLGAVALVALILALWRRRRRAG